jgi:hypothetical protein
MRISLEQILIFGPGIKSENPISCGMASGAKTHDFWLELSKIKVLKMLDLQTKPAINSDNLWM